MKNNLKLILHKKDMDATLLASSKYVLRASYEYIWSNIADRRRYQTVTAISRITFYYLKSLVQMRSTINDMILCRSMLNSFPWRSRNITRSSHVELHWFLFENLCYIFRERVKRYYTQKVRLAKVLGEPQPTWLKSELRNIDKALGDHIRRRGETVHNWGVRHRRIDLLGMVEILSKEEPSGKYSDIRSHDLDVRYELIQEAELAIMAAWDIFLRASGLGDGHCDTLVEKYNKFADLFEGLIGPSPALKSEAL